MTGLFEGCIITAIVLIIFTEAFRDNNPNGSGKSAMSE